MITDQLTRLCDAESILAATGAETVYGANSIDLLTARDIGQGRPLYVVVTPTSVALAGTSTYLDLSIFAATGVSNTGKINAGQVRIGGLPVQAGALALGEQHIFPISPLIAGLTDGLLSNGFRYLGFGFYAPGTVTTFNVTVDIVETIQDGLKFYASGIKFA